ncbi:MAG: 23S rRNA (adenine(2503)-C(2))-methyltransferase RlmN [Zetaproteobacteria bacterium CG12_big_fil_rev_8_21_14_0_65_54_13]|nr:MAG: 23S rRNA (adenine(2503)-C(2))-methyltransferase RlmN [Zetaproteobacteria bacterium CG23_combo_of_CG06-09_8_20_14_all_54_7]PIW47511.1 MAG: 23S rRNA (adenine(2503)-C(2))-methyltransferase RlmN [Zetaproteobacteria bacterium CG12_big_fil_rev_8_21_14_0_65_54_13]PIX53930.1 MAG: 23S rRNA (adenine(2503)-C(2))-methyltransferase RlmN [Zetaproteobacteria bacterium CG_4_10_14_3_um_filter_54_28]PJA30112.1 MAG: 23S rRNA (adenine(2503)-C(2))-methyltransferase RlmN [Zetaproteobacteria bacterium CG_4_9_1
MTQTPTTKTATADLAQLSALNLPALQGLMEAWMQPKFRAKQIYEWCNKGVLNPTLMKNIPELLRDRLASSLMCEPLRLIRRECSADGTRKYVFALNRPRLAGKMVEAVFIPEEKRGTVCISSQVGCVLDCPFCHTGTQGFEGNLSAGEIVAQILAIKADLRDEPMTDELHNSVTHIVYMGMGEPLANEEGVHGSLAILMDEDGLNLSRRRITVSTSGLTPQIERLGAVYPVNLAISLHSAIDEKRDVLVPINRKHPLQQLRDCLNAYPLATQRHITLEYVLLDGANDQADDLAALARFVNPEREWVNLIQFNPYPGSPYRGTAKENMNQFAQGLISKGIRATVRRSRGQDIMAACGQLKADTKEVS